MITVKYAGPVEDKPVATEIVKADVPKSRLTRLRKTGAPIPLVSRALEVEDEFRPYYGESSPLPNTYILEPPYAMESLQRVCQQNNTLGPCIDAMETNIDGTGYTIEIEDDGGKTDPEDPNVKALKGFFDEVYPGVSFMSLRRLLRRDLEQTGNAYIEVLRNLKGQIVFLRHVPSRLMRILRLDSPVVVKVSIERNGEQMEVPVMVRERRFIQMIGMKFIYFREFNSSRQINYDTGAWENPANPLPPNARGTEIIHLTLNPDTVTPYGVPRWEGQIPAALGSRKAEEMNLEFFDTGGLPPALITITGGYITEEVRRALELQMNGKNKSKHRINILEVQATGGTLDKASSADIKVETFGHDKQQDALFQKYDESNAEKIRRSFRLPSLFIGDSKQMTFAVAYTSYIVAESQLFRPDRDEFDDLVNNMIMPALGIPGYVFRSKGLSITDILIRLQGLQLAMATNYIDPKDAIATINELADLTLKPTDQPVIPPGGLPGQAGAVNGQTIPGDTSGNPGSGQVKEPNLSDKLMGSSAAVFKADNDVQLLALADKAMTALRSKDWSALQGVMKSTDALDQSQQQKFRSALALRQYMDPASDPEGLSSLAGCTVAALMHGNG